MEELPGDIMVTELLCTTSGAVFDSLLATTTEAVAPPAALAPDDAAAAAWTGLRMGLFRLFKWYR